MPTMQHAPESIVHPATLPPSGPLPWRAALLLAAVLTTACNAPESWDREYACSGVEQSVSSFAGEDPAAAIRKSYPLTIDFHLRDHNALVKTTLTVMDAGTNGVRSFSARSPSAWMSGQFNAQSAELVVIGEQTLPVAGRLQQVRTSGRYVCKTRGGPASA